MKLSELLILYRRVNGVSSREMAERLALTPSTYGRAESGRGVDARTLLHLVGLLFAEPPLAPAPNENREAA